MIRDRSRISYKSPVDFGAVRHENEPVRFRGQKVNGQGHSDTHNGQINIFSPVCGMDGRISMKVIKVTHYGVRDMDDILKVTGQRSRSQITFSENAFWQTYTDHSPSRTV